MSQRTQNSRRAFLKAGSLVFGGLSLPELLRQRAKAEERGRPAKNTSVILLFMEGGPSHMETYDMKPNAPQEYRGEFTPITTQVPGMDVCELMPLHARYTNKMTFIRSIAHTVTDHPGGAGRVLTGRKPRNISAFVSEHPTFDSIVGKVREGTANSGIPHFVSDKVSFKGGGTAYLGPTCRPFVFAKNPAEKDFSVDHLAINKQFASRLGDRLGVLKALDKLSRDVDASERITSADRFQQRAVEMLSSTATKNAFDLSQEPKAVRDRYGWNRSGQSALLARRLVEAGCSMVSLNFADFGKRLGTWDDHGDAVHIFKSMEKRLPLYDQAVTALVNDIYKRGLDERVLIVATGEFGRTPKWNMGRAKKPVFPGRDHWPNAMSVMLSGGGISTGQIIGSTNSKGEHPQDRPLNPNDLLATIYRFLGINTEDSFPNQRGRPMPILPTGKPIAGLL